MLTLALTVAVMFQAPETPLARYEKQGAKAITGRVKADELVRLDAKAVIVRVVRISSPTSALVVLEIPVSVREARGNRVVERTEIVSQALALRDIETKNLVNGEVTLEVSGVYVASAEDGQLSLNRLDPKAIAAIDAKRPKTKKR